MACDKDAIKARYDLRDVVERDLGEPARRSSRDHRYRCPFHNEQKGTSLAVYADHWHCYGKCNTGGDVISWTMRFHNLSFKEACERLGGGAFPATSASGAASPPVDLARAPEPPPEPETAHPPPDDWQTAARAVMREARNTLLSPRGAKALRYLLEQRGLIPSTVDALNLGYVPGHYTEWRPLHGLNVPCGILIPWEADGAVWGLKVRRAAGEQRYHQVAGGRLSSSLYLADRIQPGRALLVTEGEFDAMIAWQVARDLVSPVSIGSAGNAHIDRRWWGRIVAAPRLLIRMDADTAGDSAAGRIAALSSSARVLHVPQGKDVNDFYLAAGDAALRDWLASALG